MWIIKVVLMRHSMQSIVYYKWNVINHKLIFILCFLIQTIQTHNNLESMRLSYLIIVGMTYLKKEVLFNQEKKTLKISLFYMKHLNNKLMVKDNCIHLWIWILIIKDYLIIWDQLIIRVLKEDQEEKDQIVNILFLDRYLIHSSNNLVREWCYKHIKEVLIYWILQEYNID